jgi:hypothetical protein
MLARIPSTRFWVGAALIGGLWLVGFWNLLVSMGLLFAAVTGLVVAQRLSSPGTRATPRAVALELTGVTAILVHVGLGYPYLVIGLMGTPQVAEGARFALGVVTVLVWVILFGIGIILWLRRRWIVAGVPVASLIAAGALSFAGGALPAEVRPPLPHQPTTVGVIVDRDDREEARSNLTLASGERITVHLTLSRPRGSEPSPGHLLLAGHDEGGSRVWFYALPGTGDCFRLPDGLAEDLGTSIHFSFGLELPKSEDDATAPAPTALASASIEDLCVNRDGEVTRERAPVP